MKLIVPIANLIGILVLSCIDPLLASRENIADAYASRNRSGSMGSTGDNIFVNNIYRGEASVTVPQYNNAISTNDNAGIGDENGVSNDSLEQEDLSPKEARTPAANDLEISNIYYSESASCEENTENLFSVYEDIRSEISDIDQRYLENASVENACNQDGRLSTCKFDFLLYPSNLETVCTMHGGNFYLSEHSIQCHDHNTAESLYYQFDHYPSCFSIACEDSDTKRLVTERIGYITQRMSEYLQMSCYADEDILRYANDASSHKSSGNMKTTWPWVGVFSILGVLLL